MHLRLGIGICALLCWAGAAVAADADGDGIDDPRDACPASAAGTLIDRSGCPAAIPPMPAEDEDMAAAPLTPAAERRAAPVAMPAMPPLPALYFDPGSAKMGDVARRAADTVYAALRAEPALRLEIVGHADAGERFPRPLALARAAAAAAFLGDLGIDRGRLRFSAVADREPAPPDGSADGSLRNRRVEFRALP